VELTEAASALAPGATDGFQTLVTAWRKVQRTQDNHSLTVTAGPAFTAKWVAPRMFEFAQADHTTDAALAGVGVVLGRRAPVLKYLAEGLLVAPIESALATGARFWFLFPKAVQHRPQIVTFRDWIMREISKTSAIADKISIISRQVT